MKCAAHPSSSSIDLMAATPSPAETICRINHLETLKDMEGCGECGQGISKVAFFCLDCNKAYHPKCIQTGQNISCHSASPHPFDEHRPAPFRCRRCVKCLACGKSDGKSTRTCRRCMHSRCKKCLPSAQAWNWWPVCGDSCGQDSCRCGQERETGRAVCSQCRRLMVARMTCYWCGTVARRTEMRLSECAGCAAKHVVHPACAASSPFRCTECAEAQCLLDNVVWFWSSSNVFRRAAFRLLGSGGSQFELSELVGGDWRLLARDDLRAVGQFWTGRYHKKVSFDYSEAWDRLCKAASGSADHSQHAMGKHDGGTHASVQQSDQEGARASTGAASAACWRTSEYSRQEKRTARPHLLQSEDDANVYVSRSRIAGWGLFARRSLKSGEQIIEYRGEQIGRALADHRERKYRLHPRHRDACYMFALSESKVIDATLLGNPARFINHCCAPNCTARVQAERIIILAKKDIPAGTELSYDYKFAGGDGDRVKCECRSNKCRTFI